MRRLCSVDGMRRVSNRFVNVGTVSSAARIPFPSATKVAAMPSRSLASSSRRPAALTRTRGMRSMASMARVKRSVSLRMASSSGVLMLPCSL